MDDRPVDRYYLALSDVIVTALLLALVCLLVKRFPDTWPLVFDALRVSSWGCMWGVSFTGFGGGHTVGVLA